METAIKTTSTSTYTEEELELLLYPPCFGCFSESDPECNSSNCDLDRKCRNWQVLSLYEIESAAIEYEEVMKQEEKELIKEALGGDNPLIDKKIAFSGSMEIRENGAQLSHDDLADRLEKRGATFVKSPTWKDEEKRPDILVVSEDNKMSGQISNKERQAEQYGIPIISEKQFLLMYYHGESAESLVQLGVIENEQELIENE